MGGGFTARALSDAGRDVLLIDYGNEDISSADGTNRSQPIEKCGYPRASGLP